MILVDMTDEEIRKEDMSFLILHLSIILIMN